MFDQLICVHIQLYKKKQLFGTLLDDFDCYGNRNLNIKFMLKNLNIIYYVIQQRTNCVKRNSRIFAS